MQGILYNEQPQAESPFTALNWCCVGPARFGCVEWDGMASSGSQNTSVCVICVNECGRGPELFNSGGQPIGSDSLPVNCMAVASYPNFPCKHLKF